ncbi:ribosomal protein P0 (A0) (L10E) [Elasticomyces elasticus]|nr:ribosomal protein P0 (A0) (L10E) [Elasticomyces elasticus]KAK5721103.1 ribosomal protein P0 (A0) (L10E) [Elasticomyces elasticus]KAK5732712.1 ribosomal protein P0 (A0) (L10E) [Elasticomyces elasticus]
MGGKTATKAGYFDKLKGLLEEFKSIFIVTVDNVSSQQMHEIRASMRGKGVVLMGKNTMVRRAIKTFIADNPEYERLLPHVKGNVGFVFTNADLKETREQILSNRVAAPARAGAVAPGDVYVPAGNTGMEPGKTSFFQALGVPTKIARGTIEITSDVKVAEAGSRVGASEATLLNMLNISPFTYGMGISQIYDDGQCFSPDVLDIEESQLLKAFSSAIATITAVSLAANYPTIASINHSVAIGMRTSILNITKISLAAGYPTLPSVSHSILNSYKNLLAVAVETEYEWPAISQLKAVIKDPSLAQQSGPAATTQTEAPKEEAKKEEAPKEDEEEEDEDMGFGLFD